MKYVVTIILIGCLFLIGHGCRTHRNTDSAPKVEDLLVEQGDLPDGFSGGQIADTRPKMFDKLPYGEKEVHQKFQRSQEAAGGVSIFIYKAQGDLERANNQVVTGFGQAMDSYGVKSERHVLSNVGEKAEGTFAIYTTMQSRFTNGEVAFVRCGALVHIRLSDTPWDQITTYANRLDERLRPRLCK